jgi:hypothetical protein
MGFRAFLMERCATSKIATFVVLHSDDHMLLKIHGCPKWHLWRRDEYFEECFTRHPKNPFRCSDRVVLMLTELNGCCIGHLPRRDGQPIQSQEGHKKITCAQSMPSKRSERQRWYLFDHAQRTLKQRECQHKWDHMSHGLSLTTCINSPRHLQCLWERTRGRSLPLIFSIHVRSGPIYWGGLFILQKRV